MPRLTELAPGVLVATAEYATTTSTVVTGPDGGCLLIDPAVPWPTWPRWPPTWPAPGCPAGRLRHPPALGSRAVERGLGDVPRYAAAAAVAIFPEIRDESVEYLQDAVPGHDLALFGRLMPLPDGADAIPWDGPAARLIVHDGHAPGHGAVFLPDAGVLVAGDMLSDIEIPLLDTDGRRPARAATGPAWTGWPRCCRRCAGWCPVTGT